MNQLAIFIESLFNLLTSFWPIAAGLVVYIGQKFIVPQVLEYRSILKRARYDVIYHANIFPIKNNEGDIVNINDLNDASKELRIVAARLRANRDDIPFYNLVSKTRLVPNFENTEELSREFIGWSNEVYDTEVGNFRQRRRKHIAKLLEMKSY